MSTTALALRNKHETTGKVTTTRARTRIWQAAFLRALRIAPSVKHACKVAHIDRRTAYKAKDNDEEFAALWADAIAASVDELEMVAFKKAAAGDSNLITFLLRCHKRGVYGDVSRMELDARIGGVIFLPEKKAGSE